jgi:hypothetical protein
MSTHAEFYAARAAEARAAANAATLANVRDRCLRSAMAWEDMAERASRTEAARTATQAAKTAARDADH